MRKLITAIAVGALAVGLTAAPGAVAKKTTKQVSGTVTVFASHSMVEAPATTPITVIGNVKANSSCRKHRTVRFAYGNTVTGAATPLATTVETFSNGDFLAVLTPPDTSADATVVVRATVDQTLRTKKVKGMRKGAGKGQKKGTINKRKFNCLETTGDSAPITVSDGIP
jgi:hypothetical protein